jgi:hypothetical protein
MISDFETCRRQLEWTVTRAHALPRLLTLPAGLAGATVASELRPCALYRCTSLVRDGATFSCPTLPYPTL